MNKYYFRGDIVGQMLLAVHNVGAGGVSKIGSTFVDGSRPSSKRILQRALRQARAIGCRA